MANRGPDNKFLFGLLVGAGVGLAVSFLFDPKRGRQNREMLIDGARRVANRVHLEAGSQAWGDRKLRRAERKLEKRMERIRSTGF
jgi:gas vesicle protein